MKKYILILIVFYTLKSKGQDINANYQQCLQNLSQQESKENNDLLDKWYLDNPDPQKYVTSACNDKCPKYYCRAHHKQCADACNCAGQYQEESKAIGAKYTAKRTTCENQYNQALQAQQQLADQTKAAEEQKQAEEKRKNDELIKNQQQNKQKEDQLAAQQQQQEYQRKQDALKKQQADQAAQNALDNIQKQREANNKIIADGIPQIAEGVGTLIGMFANNRSNSNIDIIKDNPDHMIKTWSFGLGFGPSYAYIPIIKNMVDNNYITNTIANQYSKTGIVSTVGGDLGAEIWPFRGPHFGIGGFGEIQYYPAIIGTDNIVIYNYGGTLLLGFKRIKSIFEYSIHNRDVSYDYSGDANASSITTTGTGKAIYNTSRIGGGLMFDFSSEKNGKATNLSIMILYDRPDFLPSNAASIMVGKIQLRTLMDFLNMKFEYAHNYAIAGEKQYVWSDKSNQDYFLVSFGFYFSLLTGKY